MMNLTLETSRLRLRPLTVDDAADLFPLFHDPETVQYWPTLPHEDVSETSEMITEMLKPEKACWWTVSLREEDTAVGFVGYLGNQGVPGMGYILRRDLWGQGYTPEAMRVALDHGFHSLHLDRAEIWIHEDNIASQRVADKLGFTRKGQLHLKFPGRKQSHDMLVYGIRAEEWVDTVVPTGDHHTFFDLQPVLPVPDILEAAHFYRDNLGFTIDFMLGDPPDQAAVSRGEWTTRSARIQFTQAATESDSQPNGWLYITVGPDIDTLFKTFQDKGVPVISKPADTPWGMREFEIADNNGYRLRFGTQI